MTDWSEMLPEMLREIAARSNPMVMVALSLTCKVVRVALCPLAPRLRLPDVCYWAGFVFLSKAGEREHFAHCVCYYQVAMLMAKAHTVLHPGLWSLAESCVRVDREEAATSLLRMDIAINSISVETAPQCIKEIVTHGPWSIACEFVAQYAAQLTPADMAALVGNALVDGRIDAVRGLAPYCHAMGLSARFLEHCLGYFVERPARHECITPAFLTEVHTLFHDPGPQRNRQLQFVVRGCLHHGDYGAAHAFTLAFPGVLMESVADGIMHIVAACYVSPYYATRPMFLAFLDELARYYYMEEDAEAFPCPQWAEHVNNVEVMERFLLKARFGPKALARAQKLPVGDPQRAIVAFISARIPPPPPSDA